MTWRGERERGGLDWVRSGGGGGVKKPTWRILGSIMTLGFRRGGSIDGEIKGGLSDRVYNFLTFD